MGYGFWSWDIVPSAFERRGQRCADGEYDIVDSNWTTPIVEPARQDECRQANGAVTHHLPARASPTDDHAGSELDGVWRALSKYSPGVKATSEVLRCYPMRLDAAQVHDSMEPTG